MSVFLFSSLNVRLLPAAAEHADQRRLQAWTGPEGAAGGGGSELGLPRGDPQSQVRGEELPENDHSIPRFLYSPKSQFHFPITTRRCSSMCFSLLDERNETSLSLRAVLMHKSLTPPLPTDIKGKRIAPPSGSSASPSRSPTSAARCA